MTKAIKSCRKQSAAARRTRKKENGANLFEALPIDILINIFILLPSEVLRYKLKYVCKQWYEIITNNILLDQASIILQKQNEDYTTRLVDISRGKLGLHMKEQYLNIPYKGRIKAWCNELLLIADPDKFGSLYVYNLITEESYPLPPSSSSCKGHFKCQCGLALAFDGFKGVYKVVHVIVGESIQCEILVLKYGLSSVNCLEWRKVNGLSIGERLHFWDDPISIQGRYLYWDVHSSEYIVSMDIVKERFRKIRLPELGNSSMTTTQYFSSEMGGSLSLLHAVSSTQVDIWILKASKRTPWEKVRRISIPRYKVSEFSPLSILPRAVTILRNKRNLIFRKNGTEIGLFYFDLDHNLMGKLDIPIAADERCVVRSIAFGFSVTLR